MRSVLRKPFNGNRRPLAFERLEDRALMAGDVYASSDGEICGDDKANIIVVRQLEDCTWEVKGIKTKVNGQNCAIIDDLRKIDLKGGNDVVVVLGGKVDCSLDICDTSGNNVVVLAKLCVNGDLSVRTGGGKDIVVATCVDVKHKTDMQEIPENGVTTSLTEDPNGDGGEACFDTGGGSDLLLLWKVSADCSLDAKTGSGTDILGVIEVCTRTLCVDGGSGDVDIIGVVKSKADCAFIKGDSGKADIYAYGKNCFGEEKCSGVEVKLDVSKYVKILCELPKIVTTYAIPWCKPADLK